MNCKNESVKILLVDDDEIDRQAIVHSFRKQNITNEIIQARHGEEALDLLRGTGSTPAITQPFIVLLDINMPVMDGHEFLEKLRSDPNLEMSIVFMLTTSNNERDRDRAYKKSVSGYMLKDDSSAGYTNKVKMIDQFIRTIEFPIS